MAFDVNNFVIDHVLRGIMTSTADGSVMWSINQITEPSLSVTSETAQAVDALGSPIATFNRGKTAEFTANNSLFDLGLFAAQNGVEKKIASSSAKIVVPCFETIVVPNPNTTAATLGHTPKDTPKEIYKLKGDGTLGEKLVYSSTAGSGKFTYSAGQITFPTDSTAGDEYLVNYAGKFIMEVLGTDVCDPLILAA